MSEISFPCTGCRQTVQTDAKYVGCQTICPACNTAVLVPNNGSSTSSSGSIMKIAVGAVVGAVLVGAAVGAVIAMKNRSSAENSTPANSVANSPFGDPSIAVVNTASPASSTPPQVKTATVVSGAKGLAASNPWPQFRGPNRDARSVETGLLKSWPVSGPPLVWKATGIGRGYSSVSVAGGRVFTMGDGRDKASHVTCVDEVSGEVIWTSESVGKTGGNYAGTKSTPTLDLANGRLYALGQFGDLVCLSMGDGKEIWRKSLSGDFGGEFSNWNYAESPLLDGNRLIVTPGGRSGAVVALNTANGSTLWQSRQFTDDAQYVSTVPASFGLRPHYIQMSAQTLVGIDAENGKLIWRIPRAGKTAVIPSPVIHQNIVFVTSGYNIGCSAYQISNQGGRVTTRRLYANKDLVNHHGGVVVVDKYVYGHSDRGGWKCMDITNGQVLWQHTGVGKGSVVYADGHLICRGESGSGSIALVEATPQEYREKSRFRQPDRSNQNSWAHPVIANGKLFIRDQDVMLCFNLRET
jgi:outer membrane protein assembly factor BamB